MIGLKPLSGRKPLMVLPMLIITVMIGFRNEVGSDWWTYLAIFKLIGSLDLVAALQRTEPAYGLLNWIAARADLGIWLPNLVCGAVFTWGLIAFCRLQPNPWLALAVAVPYFVIGVGMGYTRQAAAIGFVLLALTAYYRGATVRMVIYVSLASTFHASALIMVPLLGLASVRQQIFSVLLLIVAAVLLYLQFSERLSGRLEIYTTREFEAAGTSLRLSMNLIPALIFLVFRQRFSANMTEMRLWTIMAAFAIVSVVLIFVVSASVIVDRLGLYMVPLQILVLSRIPTVFRAGPQQNMFLLTTILTYSLMLQIVWLNLGQWGHAWLPYRNYLWDEGAGKAPPRWFRHVR